MDKPKPIYDLVLAVDDKTGIIRIATREQSIVEACKEFGGLINIENDRYQLVVYPGYVMDDVVQYLTTFGKNVLIKSSSFMAVNIIPN